MVARRLFDKLRTILFPPPPRTMEDILQGYRDCGMTIGEGCKIYSALSMHKDCCLLTIGNNVTISTNVTFLMHDNAICKPTHDKYTDVLGRVNVEDNCFIGDGAIILPGVTIAHDSIIGAGSVVTKSTIPDSVYCGNPAKRISSVEEYYLKNKPYMVSIEGFTREQVNELARKHPEKLRIR